MNLVEYEELSKENFDAMVTGELAHLALWLQHEVIGIITDYFLEESPKREDFKRLIMLREGLSFQDQLDIAGALIPLLGPKASALDLKLLLKRIEDFKSYRNAMAHGVDMSDEAPENHLRIETISRSGKEKIVEITPQTHQKMLHDTGVLLDELVKARKALKKKR